MTEIRQCELCGKRTDFWREVFGVSVRGHSGSRKWKTVLCSECSRTATVEEVSELAGEHVTQYSF